MNEFDFIKAFVDVDLLEVEAVGEVVGRVIGKLFKGMVDAGVSEENARAIIRGGVAEMFSSFRPPS